MAQGRTAFIGLALLVLFVQMAQAQDMAPTLDLKLLLSEPKPDCSSRSIAPPVNVTTDTREPLSLQFASGPFLVNFDDSERGTRSMAIAFGRDDNSRVALDYFEKSSANLDNTFRLRFDDQAAWNLRVDYSLIEDLLELYGASGLGTFDPDTGENFSASRNRMYQLGFHSTFSRLDFGAEYFSAGKDFDRLGKVMGKVKGGDPKAGNAGSNLWGKWESGPWRFKGSLSRSWNNLHEDPKQPRITNTLSSFTLGYTLSTWPYLGTSLSYSRGIRESEDEPQEYPPDNNSIDRFGFNLYQTGKTWKASLSSSYDRTQDVTESSSIPSVKLTHSVSASFRPMEALTITPAFGEYRKHYARSDSSSIIRRASLKLSFAQREKDYSFKLFGAFKTNKNRNWYQDTNNLSIDGSFIRNLSSFEGRESSLSLHVGYSRFSDAIDTDDSSDDLAAWFVLRIGKNSTRRYFPDNDTPAQE